MIRKISILIVASLLALFVWLNWSALSAATSISLGWVTVQAPLGLVVLAPVLVLCVLFAVWGCAASSRLAGRAHEHECTAAKRTRRS